MKYGKLALTISLVAGYLTASAFQASTPKEYFSKLENALRADPNEQVVKDMNSFAQSMKAKALPPAKDGHVDYENLRLVPGEGVTFLMDMDSGQSLPLRYVEEDGSVYTVAGDFEHITRVYDLQILTMMEEWAMKKPPEKTKDKIRDGVKNWVKDIQNDNVKRATERYGGAK